MQNLGSVGVIEHFTQDEKGVLHVSDNFTIESGGQLVVEYIISKSNEQLTIKLARDAFLKVHSMQITGPAIVTLAPNVDTSQKECSYFASLPDPVNGFATHEFFTELAGTGTEHEHALLG